MKGGLRRCPPEGDPGTGELGTLDKVRQASDIAIAAGADFIKTSTGKSVRPPPWR